MAKLMHDTGKRLVASGDNEIPRDEHQGETLIVSKLETERRIEESVTVNSVTRILNSLGTVHDCPVVKTCTQRRAENS